MPGRVRFLPQQWAVWETIVPKNREWTAGCEDAQERCAQGERRASLLVELPRAQRQKGQPKAVLAEVNPEVQYGAGKA